MTASIRESGGICESGGEHNPTNNRDAEEQET